MPHSGGMCEERTGATSEHPCVYAWVDAATHPTTIANSQREGMRARKSAPPQLYIYAAGGAARMEHLRVALLPYGLACEVP